MVQENCLKDKNRFAIVICGPTGSGKTKLSIELAKVFNGEIVSADSIAIYKGLDIGTAKPNAIEKKQAVHHMIDVVSATDEFSVAEYVENALEIVGNLFSHGKTPIICGGTGYYIDSLLYDFSYGNCPKNDEFREDCNKILAEHGVEYLHKMLEEVDPETAEILHENDVVRVVRALEIYKVTGIKKSEIVDEKVPKFKFFAFSYDYPREVLYERINKRVDDMFENGLVDEVQGLLKNGVGADAQSMQGIGYKEIVDGLKNGLSLEDIKETVKRNSRRYAKRQITWFKKLNGIVYLKPDSLENSVQIIKEHIYESI